MDWSDRRPRRSGLGGSGWGIVRSQTRILANDTNRCWPLLLHPVSSAHRRLELFSDVVYSFCTHTKRLISKGEKQG